MAEARFVLEKVRDRNDDLKQTIVKITTDDKGKEEREEWTTIADLDRLFDACTARWPRGWDLEKLLTCVRECEFD